MVARSPLLAAGRSGGGDILVALACGRVSVSPDAEAIFAGGSMKLIPRSPLLAAGRSGGGDVLVTLACGRVSVSPDARAIFHTNAKALACGRASVGVAAPGGGDEAGALVRAVAGSLLTLACGRVTGLRRCYGLLLLAAGLVTLNVMVALHSPPFPSFLPLLGLACVVGG